MSTAELPFPNIFSVDVEDWFHINGSQMTTYPLAQWAGLESRIEYNFHALLDEFSEAGISTTCFTLGWVAEHFPGLVREAAERGHEIASHGYAHEVIGRQTREAFAADVRKSKDLLEQASGTRVIGYRAPSFSITAATLWALDELIAAGFEYDSSFFPGARELGGIAGTNKGPHRVRTANGTIIEFPMSVARLFGKEVCFFGGGYLRLFPYAMIKTMADQVNREGRPVIYYIHPREIDPSHPRMDLPLLKRWKCYVNLESTKPKLRALMRAQRLTSFQRWLASHPIDTPAIVAS